MDQPVSALISFLARGEKMLQLPWPRYRLDRAQSLALVAQLETADWSLLGLWGDSEAVHVALCERAAKAFAVASLDARDGHFPSLGQVRPGAIRLERAVQDLFGLAADGLADTRPWLDHGEWPQTHPLARLPVPAEPWPATHYPFLPVEGEGIHQIAVGPVHAGIIEPGGFRFHCNGEAVVRLEERLGYTHKGAENLMAGKTPADACRLAGRVSGDSTVACALAFAQAAEAAASTIVPARALYLRAVMAELERIANHCGDIGAICNDVAFAFMHAQCGCLREEVLRTADACFGHRLMMDRVVPGGVAVDLPADGIGRVKELMARLRLQLSELCAIYDDKPSLLDRTVGTGAVARALIDRYGVGGVIGRAAGRDFDARREPGYPPYDGLDWTVPVLKGSDVNCRLLIRVQEIGESLDLIAALLEQLPPGPIQTQLAGRSGEGISLVEGFRGDYLGWVALDAAGLVRRAHLRDPSWFQWPVLEAAIEGNIVADFPVCNKSFNCSYSGSDL